MGSSSDQTISEILEEKIESKTKKYDDEAAHINDKIRELAKNMKDATDLSRKKHKLYNFRQDLVSRKYRVMTTANKYNKLLRKLKRSVKECYDVGKSSSIVKNPQVKLKNKDERKMYYESDLRDVLYLVEMIDNHLEFITDSLKTVSDMIFGIDHVIKLEEFKSSV